MASNDVVFETPVIVEFDSPFDPNKTYKLQIVEV